MRRLPRLVLLAMVCVGVAAAADDGTPAATPYRPSVSTPAQLSAPGWLEGELGGLYLQDRHADDGAARRISTPYTVKYAFTDDWGFRIGGEAFAHVNDGDGSRDSGFGDTSLVAKRRFAFGDSAFGLELGAAFATAKPALHAGSGRTDWSLNGIYSVDAGLWHSDVNLVNTRFGARGDGQSRLQTLGAWSISRPVADAWSVTGEWSGTHQHGASGTAQLLGAVSWSLRPDLVVDFGAAHALNRATPTWQAFTGVTFVLGRLYN